MTEHHEDSHTTTLDPRFFDGTGTLTPQESAPGLSVGTVHFDAACRNHWHTHPVAQILVVTRGLGLYQEQGEAARLLQPGDIVTTGKDVNHWHGACANHSMEHVAVTLKDAEGNAVTWGRSVSDEEYEAANATAAEHFTASPTTNAHAMDNKVTEGHDRLGTFAPEFAHLNDDILFGEVWSRQEQLSARDRSLVTVISLMSSGMLDSSLRFHLQTARNNGITRQEITEAVTHVAFYVGWPKAWSVLTMAKEIWD
ncbi:cupin domain-containing carboxymuconolactone decarboxylase family protein [Bifidobacterium crudilactis]|jgi:4-carboxymuconolactone decarboxylase|uniref:cupin domain-containing carboxymuconolactone decarboxylase family protein n=1 Tax=Bifidobacterium crudilactis TaxID=327277 RepID=UPI000B1F15A8|nr:carboxymuconolactone decarboxylase family protein [Bifidobacterium crudilactis]MCI2148642.1 carboxymuconolactone decarboxylase family protein [Bifidobacterium crudilactis]MCI2157491.1 carboxymuconolactone decarboxylase family protein [Bifidobacterium crudilactis]